MAKQASAAWKVLGMILLVVVPGGSLVLLAIAAYRAYQQGRGPLAWLARGELKPWLVRAVTAPWVWMQRVSHAAAHHRA